MGGVAPRILKRQTSWRGVARFTTRGSALEINIPHRYPLDGRLDMPHRRCGRRGEKKIPAFAGN
jgi:hypothetical protein